MRPDRMVYADALRALATLAVVVNHVIDKLFPDSGALHIGDAAGGLGVDSFFVLTGFLLGRPYVEALLGRRALPSARAFLLRRFLRIWPMYAIAVVGGVVLSDLRGVRSVPGVTVLAYLALLQNVLPAGLENDFDRPLWTMPTDADFYIVLPLAAGVFLPWMQSMSPSRRARALVTTGVVALLSSVLYRELLVDLSPAIVHAASPYHFSVLRNMIGMGGPLTFGVALALIECVVGTLCRRDARRALVAGSIVAVVDVTVPPFSSGAAVFIDLIGGLSVALVLLGIMNDALPGIRAIAGSRAIAEAAASSYAIYLFHVPIMDTIFERIGGGAYRVALPLTFRLEVIALSTLAVLVVAYAAHRLVERPFLELKGRVRRT